MPGVRRKVSWRHRFRLAAGSVIFALGLCGLLHSSEAALAQWMYLKAKYGLLKGTPFENGKVETASGAFECSRRAMSIYPYNYYFPSWAAMVALEEARSARTSAAVDSALDIAYWCAREAIDLNPYYSEARYAWGEALVESGKEAEAVEFWRGVIDREFWNPDNHTHYARVLLRVGTPEARAEAVREAPFVSDAALKRRLMRLANPPKKPAKGGKKRS